MKNDKPPVNKGTEQDPDFLELLLFGREEQEKDDDE